LARFVFSPLFGSEDHILFKGSQCRIHVLAELRKFRAVAPQLSIHAFCSAPHHGEGVNRERGTEAPIAVGMKWERARAKLPGQRGLRTLGERILPA